MECATSTRRVAGATLVTCRLSSDDPREVHLWNELDGPVWPPRCSGVPDRGWDDDGVRLTVEGTVGVGYACPAPAADPPATVEVVDGDGTWKPTPDDVARALGDPSPPRDAVPDPGEAMADAEPDGGRPEGDEDDGGAGDDGPDLSESTGRGTEPRTPIGDRAEGCRHEAPSGPATVADWLATVERRVERLERLAAAETVPEATAALRAVGGLDGAVALAAAVERDREALVALGGRAERLAERAAVDPDLATVRRLA